MLADQLYQFVVLAILTSCVEHQLLLSIIGCIYVVLLAVHYIGRKVSDLHCYLTFGSRGNKIFHIKMAEEINIKTPPTLQEDISYKNWKKEIKIWQKFTSVEKEKQALAFFFFVYARQSKRTVTRIRD